MKAPVRQKDIKKLIGRIAALNRFVSRSVKRYLPLFKALKKSNKFTWTDEFQKEFEGLKVYLATVSTLAAPGNTVELFL